MKKSLLVAVAAVFAVVDANAQKARCVDSEVLSKIKFDNTAVMASSKYGAPIGNRKSVSVKRAGAENGIYGSRMASELAYDESIRTAFPVTLEEANVAEEGVVYNVKVKDFWTEGTECYGVYNPEDKTLKIPSTMTIWADESLEGLGYNSTTKTYGPLVIINIDADDKVDVDGDIVFEYDEEEGVLSFDSEKTSAYYIYALGKDSSGEEIGGWTYAYDVTIAPYNGLFSYETTAERFQTETPSSGSSWAVGEMPISYEDWGSSITINGFLGASVISIAIDREAQTASMLMGQELSTDNYGDGYGRMHLCAAPADEEGWLTIDESVESINGDYFADVEYDGRPADVIMFFGINEARTGYTYDEVICPVTYAPEGKNPYWMGGYFDTLAFVLYKSDTTGINEMKTDRQQSTKTFNMLGQEVGKGAKGLLIRDGKKFVVK